MNALRIFERAIIIKTYDHTKEEKWRKIINEETQDVLKGTHILKYSNMVRIS
jgi:hypothetical protein